MHSPKAHSLHLEFRPDELVQILTARDNIAAQDRRIGTVNSEFIAKSVKNFFGEKSDLSFIVILVIEKTIAANTVTGHTFYLVNFDGRMRIWGFAVMPEVVMAWGNVEMDNFHSKTYHIFPFHVHGLA